MQRYKSVYEFNIKTLTWSHVGSMRSERSEHRVSKVNVGDFSKFCN